MGKIKSITGWTGYIKNEADKALTEAKVKAEIFKIAHDFEIDTKFSTYHLNQNDYDDLEEVFNNSVGALQTLISVIRNRVFEKVDTKMLNHISKCSDVTGMYIINFDYLQSHIEDEDIDSIVIHTYEQMSTEEYNETLDRISGKLELLNGGNFDKVNNTLSTINKASRTLEIYAHNVITQYKPISSDMGRLKDYLPKEGLKYLYNVDNEYIKEFKVIEQRDNVINILGVEDSTVRFLNNYKLNFSDSLMEIFKKIGLDSSIKVVRVLEEIRDKACEVEDVGCEKDDEGNIIEEEITREADLPDDLVEAFDKLAEQVIKESIFSNIDKKHAIKETSTYIQNSIAQQLFKISNSGVSKEICLKLAIRDGNAKTFKKYINSFKGRINSLELFESTDKVKNAYEVSGFVYNDDSEILTEAIYNAVNAVKSRGFKVSLQIGTVNEKLDLITITNKAELKEAISSLV